MNVQTLGAGTGNKSVGYGDVGHKGHGKYTRLDKKVGHSVSFMSANVLDRTD